MVLIAQQKEIYRLVFVGNVIVRLYSEPFSVSLEAIASFPYRSLLVMNTNVPNDRNLFQNSQPGQTLIQAILNCLIMRLTLVRLNTR